MKIRRLLFTLVLVLISASGVRAEEATPAKADKPAQAGKPGGKADKPETELEKTMAKMNKAWRQVRQAAREGTLSPATADLVVTMRGCAESAAKLTPALEAEKPEAERAKFQADYQAQMKKLIEALGRLETALKANDTAAATKLVADIADMRKSGHNDFRKPNEK